MQISQDGWFLLLEQHNSEPGFTKHLSHEGNKWLNLQQFSLPGLILQGSQDGNNGFY